MLFRVRTQRAGSLADSESVAEAFLKAQNDGVPASVVIEALFDPVVIRTRATIHVVAPNGDPTP